LKEQLAAPCLFQCSPAKLAADALFSLPSDCIVTGISPANMLWPHKLVRLDRKPIGTRIPALYLSANTV
jgi:hypothetical protein